MKNYLIISLLILSVGFSQKEYDINHITEQNGVYIKKFSDERVNGKVFQMYFDMKVPLGKMKNGKKEGKWTWWYHETGTKQIEENFKDGKKEGLETCWYPTGQKFWEINYKDGELDGLWIEWYKNGKKQKKKTFKNDRLIGIETWYENGQKKREDNFKKDGRMIGKGIEWYKNGQKKREIDHNDEGYFDGLWIEWYKNGQKKSEEIWKQPSSLRPISKKCWDINGNEKECD